ncbi:MAG: hypothetical protein P8164_14315 [Gammaproteobacteria bacterium]|jgi:hypothetical protein
MRRYKPKIIILALLSCLPLTASAVSKAKSKPDSGAKELSGISVIGDKEAPKSLFIVPWKSSEIGVETSLASKLLNEKLTPVDKDVFERELDFYHATTKE